MRVTFLGTGTSNGVPVVGCSCRVCRSENPHNHRMRSSILIESGGTTIVVDTTPEFRLQALRAQITHLDAVLLTHAHADHIHGLDDIRPFSYHAPVPLYCNRRTLSETRERFPYIFESVSHGGGKPRIDLHELNGAPFTIGDVECTPIEILHGKMPILGYRFGSFAYITDCSTLPAKAAAGLRGLELLVINALRYEPHPTHLSVDEAVQIISDLSPRKAFLTHLCHDVEHEQLAGDLEDRLARGEIRVPVRPAYDGLSVEL
ncbi:MAG TPA: MBL fold metallo-hydrolase [Spirochaetia bacterium]|nr:MBL fold metallo-hydrolase [Spirochaetia bacterium]